MEKRSGWRNAPAGETHRLEKHTGWRSVVAGEGKGLEEKRGQRRVVRSGQKSSDLASTLSPFSASRDRNPSRVSS
jgi:hypothetical protein